MRPVIELGGSLGAPHFASLLYEGAVIVRVDGVRSGGRLELSSKNSNGTLAVVQPTMGPAVDVLVPELGAGDMIVATFSMCGESLSAIRGVLTLVRDHLKAPVVLDASVCGFVQIDQVIPGSQVLVFVNGNAVKKVLSPTTGCYVEIALQAGDAVTARYNIASLWSPSSTPPFAVQTASKIGQWKDAGRFDDPPGEEFLAVHAALLRDPDPKKRTSYNVLYFAGSQHDPRFHLYGRNKRDNNVDLTPPEWNNTRLWQPDGTLLGGTHRKLFGPSGNRMGRHCALERAG